MDELITGLQAAPVLTQALAVTFGGLIGVFSTLGVFFLIIWISGKLAKKDG
ncbi:MAG TPA: hypothetical protein VMV44_03910 [Rectinemataceae bacterium]|nr:hypothetical protein [Rectinemataceae bacterium]